MKKKLCGPNIFLLFRSSTVVGICVDVVCYIVISLISYYLKLCPMYVLPCRHVVAPNPTNESHAVIGLSSSQKRTPRQPNTTRQKLRPSTKRWKSQSPNNFRLSDSRYAKESSGTYLPKQRSMSAQPPRHHHQSVRDEKKHMALVSSPGVGKRGTSVPSQKHLRTQSEQNRTYRGKKQRSIPLGPLPDKGTSLPCIVSCIHSSQNLSVVFPSYEYEELLKKLANITIDDNMPPSLSRGDVCLAKFPNDHLWYRGVVVGKPSETLIKIRYVDYGDVRNVMDADVRCIPDSLCAIPAKAVTAVLKGVGTDLSAEVLPLLYQLLSSTGLTAHVHVRKPCQIALLYVHVHVVLM